MPPPTEVLPRFKLPQLKAWASDWSEVKSARKADLVAYLLDHEGNLPVNVVTSLTEARAAMCAANRLSHISNMPQRMDLSSITAAVTTAISAALKSQSPMEKACRTCPN